MSEQIRVESVQSAIETVIDGDEPRKEGAEVETSEISIERTMHFKLNRITNPGSCICLLAALLLSRTIVPSEAGDRETTG